MRTPNTLSSNVTVTDLFKRVLTDLQDYTATSSSQIYTTIQKFEVSKFLMVLKEVQGYFYLLKIQYKQYEKSNNYEIFLQFKITAFIVTYQFDVKLNFQQSLLQFPMSHDPAEIILICWSGSQET